MQLEFFRWITISSIWLKIYLSIMASKYDKNLINIATFSHNLKILHTKSCFERTYILAIYKSFAYLIRLDEFYHTCNSPFSFCVK